MTIPTIPSMFFVLFLLLVPSAFAQTPDANTPAVEEACTKYEGEGARHGLCVAYCEAQDCDNTKFSNPSCSTIAERFIVYSEKQGYAKGPSEKSAINCKVTACTSDDVQLCFGTEIDCDTNGDRICEHICTSTVVGFQDGKVVCSAPVKCSDLCVGEDPHK